MVIITTNHMMQMLHNLEWLQSSETNFISIKCGEGDPSPFIKYINQIIFSKHTETTGSTQT